MYHLDPSLGDPKQWQASQQRLLKGMQRALHVAILILILCKPEGFPVTQQILVPMFPGSGNRQEQYLAKDTEE